MVQNNVVFPATRISEISFTSSKKDLQLFYTQHWNCICQPGEKTKAGLRSLNVNVARARTERDYYHMKYSANNVSHLYSIQMVKLTLFDFLKISWFKKLKACSYWPLSRQTELGSNAFFEGGSSGMLEGVRHLQNIQFGSLGSQMLEVLHVLQQREAGITANEPRLHPFSLQIIRFWQFYLLIFQTLLLSHRNDLCGWKFKFFSLSWPTCPFSIKHLKDSEFTLYYRKLTVYMYRC